MSAGCSQFRARLAQALDAPAQREGPLSPNPALAGERVASHLEWQAHVLTCGECRALLEAEQALEHVLASLPQPRVPAALVSRVLERLQPQRVDVASDRGPDRVLDQRLDRVLDQVLDHVLGARSNDVAAAPPDLARVVLARLAPARDAAANERRLANAVDALLDAVPPPQTPVGLAARVLARLDASSRGASSRGQAPAPASSLGQALAPASSRGQARSPARRTVVKPPLRAVAATPASSRQLQPWLAAAGLAAVVGAAVWFWSRRDEGGARHELGDSRRDVASNESASKAPAKGVIPNDVSGHDVSSHDVSGHDVSGRGAPAELAPSRVTDPAPEPPNAPNSVETLDALEPEPELLAQLDLLEAWELLGDEALDLELLGVDEDTLLGLQSTDFESGEAQEAAPSEPDSKRGESKPGEVRNG